MITRLETENLILRKPMRADWDAFLEFYQSEQSKTLGGPFGQAHSWRVFASLLGQWALFDFGPFCVTTKEGNSPLGMVGPWTPVDYPEKEIMWSVFAKAQGKSIAYEAAKRCVSHVYEDLGWDTAVSYIDVSNTRSNNLANRLGASIDENAPVSELYTRDEMNVYRHPHPGAMQ